MFSQSSRLVLLVSVLSVFVFFIPTYVNSIILNPFFLSIALLVARFLAGVGAFSIFLNLSIFVYKLSAPKLKKRREEAYKLRRNLIKFGYLYFIALIGYYLFSMFFGKKEIDILFLLFGLVTVIVTVFIIPIWQEASEFKGKDEMKTILLEKASEITLSFKKIYYEKLVRDYGKAFALEFLRLKNKLDKMRLKVARYSLFLIGVSILPILPVAILTWYKFINVYILNNERFDESTKLIIILAILTLLAYTITVIIFEHIVVNTIAWEFPYVVGSLIALMIYHKNINSS